MMFSGYATQRPSQQSGTEAQPPRQATKNAVEVAQKKPRAGKPQDDASYWASRAERSKHEAARPQN